jgi:hypothetical protein
MSNSALAYAGVLASGLYSLPLERTAHRIIEQARKSKQNLDLDVVSFDWTKIH